METAQLRQLVNCSKLDDQQRVEALERLHYLAMSRGCGVLTGPTGSGRTTLFQRLATELRRNGQQVVELNLRGVTDCTVLSLLAGKLGLGLAPDVEPLIAWSVLSDFALSSALTCSGYVFLVDDADYAEDCALGPFTRIMEMFRGSSAFLFAIRPQPATPLREMLNERSWLRIELAPPQEEVAADLLQQTLQGSQRTPHFQPDGLQAAVKVAQGRLDRIERLGELAGLVAHVDNLHEVNADVVRALAQELHYSS